MMLFAAVVVGAVCVTSCTHTRQESLNTHSAFTHVNANEVTFFDVQAGAHPSDAMDSFAAAEVPEIQYQGKRYKTPI